MKGKEEVTIIVKGHPAAEPDEGRTEYLKHREYLTASGEKHELFIDRTILYILTAGLAFSLHFVFSNKLPLHWLAYLFWGLLFFSLILFLLHYKFLSLAYCKALKILDDNYSPGSELTDNKNPFELWYRLFGWLAYIYFIGGLITMFVYLGVIAGGS